MRLFIIYLLAFCLAPALGATGYFPENHPQSGGMRHQVLFYNLNSASGRSQSRMPWISADEKTLYYAVGEEGIEEIWVSQSSSGQWLSPSPVTELNQKGYSSQSPCLSPDGQKLYFTSNRPLGSNRCWRIYVSEKDIKGNWGTPQSIEMEAASETPLSNQGTANEDTTASFSHPQKTPWFSSPSSTNDYAVFLSRDGKALWFTSNREGGLGGYDIWKSNKNPEGKWLAPVNMGEPLNTPGDEKMGLSVSADNQRIYFSSDRQDIRTYGEDTWNIYQAELTLTPRGLKTGTPSQVSGISPAQKDSGWGVDYPCLSAEGKNLYYSGKGPLMWVGDKYDIFKISLNGDNPGTPKNLGRKINNIIWYKDEEYLPYVAYLADSTYEPKDWMFDSGLFLGYSGSSSGQDYGWGKTLKDDWTDYLNAIFMPHRQLQKLDEIIGRVKLKLKDPSYQMKMAVMIPCANSEVEDFGDIDGDGLSENMSIPGNRLKTEIWYLNELLNRWDQANLKNIKLVALYWMKEDVKKDRDLVKAVSDEVHKRGLLFEWIPYFKADYQDWKDYGFDFVEYQPNYAWMHREYWGQSPDPQQLVEAAKRARDNHMGIEIEFDYRALTGGINLRAYLDHGALNREKYMNNCLTGYYQEVYTLAQICYSSSTESPWARDAYDNLYRYIHNTYPECLSYGKKYTYIQEPSSPYSDNSLKKLNDYRFLPDILTTQRTVGFHEVNPVITYDLGNICRVEKVYAHLLGGDSDENAYPKDMRVEVSLDGKTWKLAGSSNLHLPDDYKYGEGDMLVKFPPQKARYVKTTLLRDSPWVCLDELQIYGFPQ